MKFFWSFLLLMSLTACSTQGYESDTVENLQAMIPSTVSRRYTVRQEIFLHNRGKDKPDQQNLWIALIRDLDPYQIVTMRDISPNKYQIITDEYGNQYAEFDLKDHPPGTTIAIEIEYLVTIYEQNVVIGNCIGHLPDKDTQPELHIESANSQIVTLSEELSQGQETACAQVRAFYDYIGDELIYSYNQKNWGAQAALGPMGADCTEYSSLMIALSRGAGIPARYYEGLLYLGDHPEGIAQTQHAWLDVYLPGAGWASMDPTLGRALTHRDNYFAHHTPDHIIVTVGRNPSTLRGSSYWSHLYWPGDRTTIHAEASEWIITAVE